MPIKSLTPYLFFNGSANDAIKLYETALGARAENVMHYGAAPAPDGKPWSEEDKHRVIHALLKIGDVPLMLSDSQRGEPVPVDSNVHVSADFDDAKEMARAFEALATGGKVTQPLTDTFWGAKFGMLIDRFGIKWMFNCQHKQ